MGLSYIGLDEMGKIDSIPTWFNPQFTFYSFVTDVVTTFEEEMYNEIKIKFEQEIKKQENEMWN